LNAVAEAKGDKLLAAKMLGIGKTTLYRKLQQYEAVGQGASENQAIPGTTV
jgi:two-component system response regulator HydG